VIAKWDGSDVAVLLVSRGCPAGTFWQR